MFPRLLTQATYLQDAEFASWKQKCFAFFPFAHTYNTVSNIDSKYFCSNVSSFAPTLTFSSKSASDGASLMSEEMSSGKNSFGFFDEFWTMKPQLAVCKLGCGYSTCWYVRRIQNSWTMPPLLHFCSFANF